MRVEWLSEASNLNLIAEDGKERAVRRLSSRHALQWPQDMASFGKAIRFCIENILAASLGR